MDQSNLKPIPSLGTYRKRQQAAKDRADQRKAAPDVRAARAAILDAREAGMLAEEEARILRLTRPGEVYRKTLDLVPDEVLHEMQRSLPSLSTREMGDIIGDVLTGRRRNRQAADFAASAPDAPIPARKPTKAA